MAPFPERRRGRPHPSRPRAPSRAAPSAAGPSEARLGRSRKQRVSSSPPSAHVPPPPGEHTGKSPPCRDARLPGGPGRPADGVPAGLPARRRLQREGVTSAPAREASELGCTWGLRTPRRGHREGRGHGTVHGAAPDLAASVSLLPEPTALTFSRVSFSSLSGGRGGQGTERAGRRRSAFLLWRLWARAQTMPSAQPGAADGAPRALLALGPPKAPARTPRHSNDLTAQRTDLVTCPRPGSRVHPCPCKDMVNTLPSGTCSGESTNERMTVTPFDSFREQGRKPSDRHTVRPGRVGTAEIIREDAARTAVPHSPSCEGCR